MFCNSALPYLKKPYISQVSEGRSGTRAEKWSTQPLYLGASGTVKVWFRYPCLFAGSSSGSEALPVRPKGTNARQTEMFQSTVFTCVEILFCMKKAFSIHELKFFFWKTSLSRKILNTENFYPNVLMRTNIQILEKAAARNIPTLKQLLDFGCH